VVTVAVDTLTFSFPDNWLVTKYDDWPFYRNRFKDSCGGNKAIDLLAFDPGERTLWLVEAKDYRLYPRAKEIALWEEIGLKLRDTLAGLVAARFNAALPESEAAYKAVRANRMRFVLHWEQPQKVSASHDPLKNLADLRQKLRQTIKPIDPHPLVVDMAHMGSLEWSVR
jgi:hypothetical protein